MTRRERELLRVIESHTADHDGVAPTYDMMAEALGLKSKSNIFRMVEPLVGQGRLERRPGKRQSLAVVAARPALVEAADQDLIAEVFRRFGADAGAACSRAQQRGNAPALAVAA